MIKNETPVIVDAIHGSSGANYSNQQHNYNDILSIAQGRWPYVLTVLGINERYLINKHGPCPICGGKDRFRFDDQMKGRFICNRCGSGYGLKLLQLYYDWSFSKTIAMVAEVLGSGLESFSNPQKQRCIAKTHNKKPLTNNTPSVVEHKKYLGKIWRSAQDITTNDPVYRYLRSRDLRLTQYPKVLRYYPGLNYYENGKFLGKYDAMLALVTDAKNNCVSIHRTYIENCAKAAVASPKKLTQSIYPGATMGAAIRLYEPTNGQLGIAEGIETALAFHRLTGIPVWATLNAHGMKNLILPNSVTDVVIAADNDQSGVGQMAAIALSNRLLAQGLKVKQIIPSRVNCDFNDVLREGNL